MAEWLKALAWKACIRETVSWVRIPLPPPECCLPLFAIVWKSPRNQDNPAVCFLDDMVAYDRRKLGLWPRILVLVATVLGVALTLPIIYINFV
jgi:hypothetical protein